MHAKKHMCENTCRRKGNEEDNVLDMPQGKYKKEVNVVPKSQCGPAHVLGYTHHT